MTKRSLAQMVAANARRPVPDDSLAASKADLVVPRAKPDNEQRTALDAMREKLRGQGFRRRDASE